MREIDSEQNKYKNVDESYFKYIETVLEDDQIDKKDIIYNFPVYVGQVNLARYLCFYDLYNQVSGLSGHIADIGTYKGASFLFMAKMVKLFEPYSITQVHGFDWFNGMEPSKIDDDSIKGKYVADYDSLMNMIELQNLKDVAVLHKMDITKELEDFMIKAPHLRFKYIFIDCGISDVLEKSLEVLWPRLVPGGVLLMDHYNCKVSPSESNILEKYIGENIIEQVKFTRSPTCYVIKKHV